jgi:hypothetical protein
MRQLKIPRRRLGKTLGHFLQLSSAEYSTPKLYDKNINIKGCLSGGISININCLCRK